MRIPIPEKTVFILHQGPGYIVNQSSIISKKLPWHPCEASFKGDVEDHYHTNNFINYAFWITAFATKHAVIGQNQGRIEPILTELDEYWSGSGTLQHVHREWM